MQSRSIYEIFGLTLLVSSFGFLLLACDQAWNNPNTQDSIGNVQHSAFTERPKFLDPARSYSSNEYTFIGNIYEPPLQYHYLKRPYQLDVLTAKQHPRIRYLSADGEILDGPEQAVYVDYEIEIRSGIYYQPHPAFVRRSDRSLRYFPLLADESPEPVHQLSDFPEHDTRELTAEDYVYQIKRLADPAALSPVAGLFAEHILGFTEVRDQIGKLRADLKNGAWLDLRQIDMAGVEVLDRYRYRIRIHQGYPQFIYWLAMPFFAPMPWEADALYSQKIMADNNITLNWYPVGTGPYMLSENNPNMRMVLERNPHYRQHDYYPRAGAPNDMRGGLLKDAGEPMPFIDKVVFSLEKEGIPYWNKFLQGYYDSSGISSDSFDQAMRTNAEGEFGLSDEMQERGIDMATAVATSIIYIGFNMLDPVIGGFSERAVKLRRALSITIDFEEYISIFLNGRGVVAQGALPPGIFGHVGGEAGVNPYVYDWRDAEAVRKPLAEARRLLAEAGYKNGINQQTGEALVLYFDTVGSGPDAKSFLNWMRKQFAKLDIQLVIRNTDYNRFQEKMLNGNAQIFRWGWNADYPDPENFLFLFYGPHAKANDGGENASNYQNPEFDRLFERMKSMPNNEDRQHVINQMIEILRTDAPWIWGYHPKLFLLHYAWFKNIKPHLMAHNTLKYHKLDPELRAQKVEQWNRPRVWPLVVMFLILVGFLLPAIALYYRRLRETAL